MSKVWEALEAIPGLSAVGAEWRSWVGAQFPLFKTAFLQKGAVAARSYPCPLECGCAHEVVRHDDDRIVAVCRCEPWNCDDIKLAEADLVVYELSWTKFGRSIATAFGCEARAADFGMLNTRQTASYSSDAVPVIVTIQSDRHSFRRVVAELVARLRQRFILFAPTSRFVDGTSKELLENVKARFFDLESHLVLTGQGNLQSCKPAAELFSGLAPAKHRHTADVVSPPSATARLAPYVIRQGLRVWKVVFDGKEAELKDEKGLHYVAYLLKNPPMSPIHGVELAALLGSRAAIQELSLRREDATALLEIQREAKELAAVREDPEASDMEKDEARQRLQELAELRAQGAKHPESNAERTVRAVRKAIQRLHRRLATAKDRHGKPHPVLRPFALHLEKHLLNPSARFAGHGSARVKAGVAGCFTYEPPPGVSWSD